MRASNLGFKLMALVAATFLVTACSDEPYDETASQSNGGMNSTMNSGIGGNGVNGTGIGAGDMATQAGDRVFFQLDSSEVTSEGQETLRRQAQWLNAHAGSNATIEGHCDERGTREYNLALGERRAAAVRNFLIAQGVDAGKLTTISYGKERPAVAGTDESAFSQNRRGVTVIN